ncbi:MAG: PAS domain-containing protein [Rhodospirillaceae bacterium]|nr:PAS domain-containing protein [Rhodospirillaceae bacterium]
MSTATNVLTAPPRQGPAARKLSRTVTPTQTEVFFERNDLIVSKTDLKGNLTYVNEIFLRISEYSEAELLGQPHSFIRHPSMPRCVFKLLWDRLQAGAEIFAYVKNMTKSGAYYWVLAHATPSVTASGEVVGYHSNRRVPERKAVDVIVPLYAALKSIEDTETDRRAGLMKSSQHLQDILSKKGIGYDEFIHGL